MEILNALNIEAAPVLDAFDSIADGVMDMTKVSGIIARNHKAQDAQEAIRLNHPPNDLSSFRHGNTVTRIKPMPVDDRVGSDLNVRFLMLGAAAVMGGLLFF